MISSPIMNPRNFSLLLILSALFLFSNPDHAQAGPAVQEEILPPLSLVGVIIAENASSIAILKNQQTGKTAILSVGENILGFTLSQVHENRVVLRKGEKTFQVFLGRGSLVRTVEPAAEKPIVLSQPEIREEPLESPQPAEDLIRMEFNRAELESRLQTEMPLIMQEARFVPNIVEGRVSGFRITSLPRSSVISEVGIRPNDVIKKINNVELNTMDNLFALYNRFKDENRFDVTLERSGKTIRILYTLK